MKLRAIIVIVLCILLASLTCVPALADLIFEPNDKFYEQNSEKCTYINRSFTAAGKNGTVAVVKEPGSAEIVETVNNGNVFYVSFTYTDKNGVTWGVVMFNPDGTGNLGKADLSKAKNGWIRMSELKLVYDYISFKEDHQSEFKPYTGSYGEFKAVSEIALWTYPGSGVITGYYETKNLDGNFKISDTYTDSDGIAWGFIEFCQGFRNVWVCISNPSGALIETTQPPTPSEGATPASAVSAAPVQTQNPSQPPSGSGQMPQGTVTMPGAGPTPMLLVIIGIVVAVVATTCILMVIFWKKNTLRDKVAK